MSSARWTVREGRSGDVGFIVKSWRASYQDAPEVRGSDRRHYRAEMSRRIASCLTDGQALVACLEQDEDTILGFAVASADGRVLHYVYVRLDARGIGVARELVGRLDVEAYTHRAHKIRGIPPNWVYKPFIFGAWS